MYRRQFLASVAAPLAASAAAPLRIAFFGGAHPHTPAKVAAVKAAPDYELVGMCEDDPAVRARFEKAGIRFLTREQVLADSSIRVIAVGSAVRDHARDAAAALSAGRHVHLEKPPATTIEDFRRISDLAGSKGLLLQLGYMWRYNPAINAALEAARNGWLGDIHTVRGVIDTTTPAEERPALAAYRGGMMFELGCHLLDPTVRLLGRPVKVTPFLRRHGRFEDSLADNTAVVLEYPRALATISSSALRPNAFRQRFFEIMGSGGTATVRPLEPPVLELDLAKAAGPYPAARSTPKLPVYNRYMDDFAGLARSIAERSSLPVTPGEDMLVQEVLLRACEM